MPEPKWEEFLRRMSVPGYPGLYVLGCFSRHVTLYSQQVRALNLVEALCRTAAPAQGARVAVIGAGAAGITAAAAAGLRGLRVTLLEKRASPLEIQRSSGQRYLHPHVYDWPAEEHLGDDARLPILNWQAGWAKSVAGQIEKQWNDISTRGGVAIDPRWRSTEVQVTPRDGGGLRVNWNDGGGPHNEAFQHVILSVGFGLEAESDWQHSYWQDDGLDFHEEPESRKRWLVSGYGDGGLTDLMRLCINDFRHDQIVKRFAEAPEIPVVREKLLGLEQEAAGDREVLTEAYQALTVEPLLRLLEERLSGRAVTLTGGSPLLYGPESSILNRLIVSQLARLDAFTHVPGPIGMPPERTAAGTYQVRFADGKTREFDRVVPRHGPARAVEADFRKIWDAAEVLREEWRRTPSTEDFTRRPLWSPDAYTEDDSLDLRERMECLVCLPGSAPPKEKEGTLLRFIRHALIRRRRDIEAVAGRPVKLSPKPLYTEAAFASLDAYETAVREICRADLAVLDLTGYESGMMLLLGLRSAVRRGVTLTAGSAPLQDQEWSVLPFNLKELNPVSYHAGKLDQSDSRHPINRLGSMIERGLSLFGSMPRYYLDLPAFDAVRRLGSLPEQYEPVPLDRQILVLCSFDPDYLSTCWQTLSEEIGTAFSEQTPTPVIVRVIDLVSPRLVSHRLYEEIRRSSACLVDWTGWRPNVFYELGVRLATNEIGPVCVLAEEDRQRAEAAGGIAAELLRLFAPLPYRPDGDSGEFRRLLRERFEEVLNSPTSSGAAGDRTMVHGHTFRVVQGEISLEQEPGGAPVHRELRESAEALIGVEPQKQGRPPLLFFQNRKLMTQARAAAVERLLAAWYYLRERWRAGERPAEDPLREEYLSLGRKLAEALLDSRKPDDRKLGFEIGVEVGLIQPDTEGASEGGGTDGWVLSPNRRPQEQCAGPAQARAPHWRGAGPPPGPGRVGGRLGHPAVRGDARHTGDRDCQATR